MIGSFISKITIIIALLIFYFCPSVQGKEKKIVHGKKDIRFLISIPDIYKSDRKKNILLGKWITEIWNQITGFDCVLYDSEFLVKELDDKKKIPSTNFWIYSQFLKSFEGFIFVSTIVDKESGEIVAKSEYSVSNTDELEKKLPEVLENLIEKRSF